MSIARDIMDRIFYPDRDVHPIPVLDGGFTPNLRLEQGRVLCDIESPDSLVREAAGSFLVSSLDRILRIDADGGGSEVMAEAGATAGALALGSAGEVYAAVAGRGVVAYAPDGREIASLGRADGAALNCVTALAVGPDGDVFITNGSAHNDVGHWLRDLMQKHGPTGRLITCNGELGKSRTLREKLSWPDGVAVSPDGGEICVSEAWAHRLVSVSRNSGEERVLVKNFSGYPARISPAAKGGMWISFFALRTQLTEFVLRENAFRKRMVAQVQPDLWIGPTLGGRFDYREPTQIGRIKKLGIQKPWAPARSYGLVARLDDSGSARESLHSRVSGSLHGVTDALESDGRLYFVSKGHGKLAMVDLAGDGE